ncbi:polynucleotide 5'-hydroxyl-kinase NOL9 [Leptopilina boulardi]|uniref:polynucleotide 5'-hydroxyl-kinase NOL9 n=1 Tax=Leptopilina boulardi TaxID=63433 RepID=UPI0021F5F039|nr:polynucleotide 5'-hydroxyl-kinase NOL9 [Leptopilina boulardi]XP_051156559.1 polynucleotide 5'-hydroxyl-kinase NOL9 [Leptopilina boulardi]
MEDNYEIETGINLTPNLYPNFKKRSQGKKLPIFSDFEKISSSRTPVKNNLKKPLVIQTVSNSDEESVEFISQNSENEIQIPSNFSENNKSFENSYIFERTNISELSINDSENISYDNEQSTHEIYQEKMEMDNIPQFYCLKNKVVVIMKPNTTFWFCGKLKVQILYGAIKIYGAVLNTLKTFEVYSPRSHSLLSIEQEIDTLNCDKEKLWQTLVAEGVDRNLESSLVLIINQCQPEWTVVLMENLTNHLTTFLNTYCSFKLFPRIEDQTFYSWNDLKRAELTLQTNLRFNNIGKQLVINPEWKIKIVDNIINEFHDKQQSINLIFGGKSVGKSTFSKYLANTILQEMNNVIFVNLDPGQTECTPSGCISLNLIDTPFLGPNFTQLRTPYYQIYIGDINVANCVTRYLEAVKMLVNRLKNDSKISQLPVIINTMGFCKGIGWDIALCIIRIFQPTNVIQIMSKKARNNFENYLTKDAAIQQKLSWTIHESDNYDELSYKFHQINSEAEIHGNGETFNLEPYQKRDLVMLAYLSQITRGKQPIKSLKNTIPSINDITPYKGPLSSLYLSLTQTGVPLTHVLAAMNGNIVALCGYDPSAESNNLATHSKSENSHVLIRTPLTTCYGFGIIRGIDMEQKILYINTPLEFTELKQVNCLVDCLPIPTALLPLNLPNAPYMGNKADLPTSKEHRRGFFRIRNKTTRD